MSSGADEGTDTPRPRAGAFSVDIRDSQVVQVGDGNTQVIHVYNGTWATDGVAPSPMASGSGAVNSPYRGLGAFGERDAPFFFGREEAATQVLERMSGLADGQGMLVVSGASGVGKSSLLQAGILPRLRGAGLPSASGAASWPCLLFVPGRAPLDELAARVALLAGTDAGIVRRGLETDPAGFALTARQAALAQLPAAGTDPGAPITQGQAGGRLLLIVDQFEQVFTQCADEGQRRAFIAALHAAAHGPGGTPAALVVLGVRADFEARCAGYPELAGAVQDRYLVTPMTERQLRLAITGPARQAGAQVDDELTGTLLADVARQPGGAGAGVLPLLSHALDEAWRKRAGQDLSLADYERAGGIEGAVAASAERAYGKLTPGRQAAARQVFTRLVAASPDGADTADRATRAELADGKGPAEVADVEAVLEAFAAERLLTLGADSVEISHEALLAAWPLLRDTWLAETHADRIVRTRLRGTAAEWERRSRDPSYLYRGGLLLAAAETAERAAADPAHNPPLGQSERDFLDASSRASRRSRRWRQAVIAVLAALALTAGGLALWANQQRAAASQQRDQAIENQIVAEAGQLSATDPSLAAQLLLTAYRRDPSQDLASRLISTENQPLSVSEPTSGPVLSVAFSPDGNTLATADYDGTVTLWNTTDPGQPRQLGHPLTIGDASVVESVAFSQDGKTLAAGDYDGTVTLWNVTDTTRPHQLGRPLHTSSGSVVFSVAFSPGGKTLAAGDSDALVTLWDTTDPGQPHQLGRPLHTSSGSSVFSVAFSPDGKTLAAGDSNDQVTLWDITGLGQPRQPGHPFTLGDGNAVHSVAFSPGGKTLAIGGSDGQIVLWSVADAARPLQLGPSVTIGNGSVVYSVAFSPDGKTLAVGDDGTATVWNVTDPGQPRQLGHVLSTSNGSAVYSVKFSADGKTLAVGDDGGTATVWNLPPTTLLASTKGATLTVESVAFSPDGKTLAVGDDYGAVALWNVTDPGRPRQLGHPFIPSNSIAVYSVAFSPGGKTLAVGSSNGAVTLWDVADPARPRQLGHPLTFHDGGTVHSVAFSPDGKTLAVGYFRGQVALWDVADPARPRQLGHPITFGDGSTVESVAFGPGGKTLATGDYDGAVALWDVADPARPPQLSRTLTTGDGSAVFSVAFGPGGKTLAVGGDDGTVTLWDVADPARPRQLGHPLTASDGSSVHSVAFSPGGRTLAASGNDGTVTLWDVADPARPRQLGHPLTASNSVFSVAFGPGGRTLAVGETGAITQIWDLDVSYAISRTCQLASRTLTPKQWHQYIPQLNYDPPCPANR